MSFSSAGVLHQHDSSGAASALPGGSSARSACPRTAASRLEWRLRQIERLGPKPKQQLLSLIDTFIAAAHAQNPPSRPGSSRAPAHGLRIFTIGYEGASVESFLQTLWSAGVTRLLDVRELPLSRRKGFSKNALAGILIAAGIDYQHSALRATSVTGCVRMGISLATSPIFAST